MQESGTPQPPQEAGSGGGADEAELFTVDQLARISENPDPDAYDLAGDRVSVEIVGLPDSGETRKKGVVRART